jgi:hypothetical protein
MQHLFRPFGIVLVSDTTGNLIEWCSAPGCLARGAYALSFLAYPAFLPATTPQIHCDAVCAFGMQCVYGWVLVCVCTVLYCTVLYCTVLYCTVLYIQYTVLTTVSSSCHLSGRKQNQPQILLAPW